MELVWKDKEKQWRVVLEICTVKHLVYKLWVSDCETETGDKKKLKCYTNHPFPFNLLFGFTLNFFPLSLLKLICFK